MDAKRAAYDDDIMIIDEDFDDIEILDSFDGSSRPRRKVDYGDEVQFLGEVHPSSPTGTLVHIAARFFILYEPLEKERQSSAHFVS